jgi:hypothetical protein
MEAPRNQLVGKLIEHPVVGHPGEVPAKTLLRQHTAYCLHAVGILLGMLNPPTRMKPILQRQYRFAITAIELSTKFPVAEPEQLLPPLWYSRAT